MKYLSLVFLILAACSSPEKHKLSLTADSIRKTIRLNKSTIGKCYEEALSTDSTVSGKINLYWKITT